MGIRNTSLLRRAAQWFARPEDTVYGVAECTGTGNFECLKHFTREEYEAVAALIGSEIEKSRTFGLFVERRDFEEEIKFFTYLLDLMGGVKGMRERHTPELFQRVFSEMRIPHFEREILRYRAKTAAEDPHGVKNRYECHLESVQHAIFHAIYSSKEW